MNIRKLLLAITVLTSINSFGQEKIDLTEAFKDGKIEAINKVITVFNDSPNALEIQSKESVGMGMLSDMEFETGSIELELLGENKPGQSFIGLAFNIQNDSTYEAVYFRPFNFVAEEQIRKDHMTQYVYEPEFGWRKLRNERTGEFENEISPAPNPDDWFKVKIDISTEKVSVYVNDSSEPTLQVTRLSTVKSNKIAIWTGFGSSGRFRNLAVQKD